MDPITREEQLMAGEQLEPITRKEYFLAKAAGMDVETPEPITREEMFLSMISGGGTGGSGGADWNAKEGEPGYVKNRTHYEEITVVNKPLNITWYGNGEGLVSFEAWGDYYYKVSDLVLTDEQIKLIEMDDFYGDHTVVSEVWDHLVDSGSVMEDIVLFNLVLFVRKDNLSFMDITIPEKGIYFARWPENYITTITTTEPITIPETTIKTIDEKFLPIGKPLFVNIQPTGGYSITGTTNMPYAEFRYLIENNVYFGAYVCYSEYTFAPIVVVAERSDCLVLRFSDNTDNPILTVYWLPDDTFTLEDPME